MPVSLKTVNKIYECLIYLAVFELSTTVTVLSWLTQARRLPEAEKDTEWTQPPPPKCKNKSLV